MKNSSQFDQEGGGNTQDARGWRDDIWFIQWWKTQMNIYL